MNNHPKILVVQPPGLRILRAVRFLTLDAFLNVFHGPVSRRLSRALLLLLLLYYSRAQS